MSRVKGWMLGVLVVLSAAPAAAQVASSAAFAPAARHAAHIVVSGMVAAPDKLSSDFAGQAESILAELATRLKAQGSSMGQVVSTTVYLRNIADFPALNAAWKKQWPIDPPARTTVVAASPGPAALLQVSAMALTDGTERQVVLPAGWQPPASPYSYAIKSGDALFVSGLVSRRGIDNAPVAGDIGVQTATVLDNAKTILAAAGFTPDDVIIARVYLTDVANFQGMNAAYQTAFTKDPPARATVRTGLTGPDYLVEITLIAIKGRARSAINQGGRANPLMSSAILVGTSLHTSGMLGLAPSVPATIEAQTAEALTRLENTLKTAGYTWADVFDSVIYVTDFSYRDAVVKALEARMGGRPFAGTVVETGLVVPAALVEISLTAGK
jgi:2-iminobutanoate/2-iminopropanoate deaminase